MTDKHWCRWDEHDCEAAYEEIERLTAQNANLRRWQALGKPLTAAMSIVVDDMQELRAEIDQLTGSKAALQTEIERLQAIVDGNERCQAEYLAIIEKKTIECDQTWTKHLIIREELKSEMTALQMALIRATAEIAQLKNGVS